MFWQSLFLLLTAVFIIGDYCGLQSSLYGSVSATIAILTLFAMCRKHMPKLSSAILLCLLLFLYLGIFLGYNNRLQIIEQNIAPFLNKQVQITGYIQDTPPIRSERSVRIQVNLEQIEQASYPQYLANIYLASDSSIPAAGSLVSIQSELRAIQYFNNPSNFDLREKYYLRNIVGNIYLNKQVPKIIALPKQESLFVKLQKISSYYREQLLQIMPAKQAALVQALILGGSRDIPASIWHDFTLTGLIHVLCISGLHTGLVALLLLSVCRFLFRHDKLAAGIAISGVLLYMLISGLSLPIIRAGIMSIILIAAAFVGRKAYTPAVFAFTLLIMVAVKANIILELSFQLTFLATGALIFVAPRLHQFIARYTDSEAISLSLAAVCSVQLVLLPILVNNFHQFSLIALFSNMLLVPLVEIIIILIVFGSALLFILPALGKIILVGSSILLDAVVAGNAVLADLPLSSINIPHLPTAIICLYYTVLLLLVFELPFFKTINYYKQLIASLFFAALCMILFLQTHKQPASQIHFIDVGQGDAALLISRQNRAILIDTGGISSTFDIGERVINPYLRYLGLNKIELLILSHAHFDHAAGSLAVSKSFPISNVILPLHSATAITRELEQTLTNTNFIQAQAGSLQLDEWQLQIIHTPQTSKPNDSLVVIATSNGFSTLFTADIDASIEAALLPNLQNVDILKVAHHGSAHSTSTEFLQILRPRLSIVSVGKNNMYNHPASQTLERLENYSGKILRTDEDGAIVITFVPDKIFINTNKKEFR